MKCNDVRLKFCVYIINQLSQLFNKPTYIIFQLLSESGILDEYIINCYDTLHTLGREYLVDDIAGMLRDKGIII